MCVAIQKPAAVVICRAAPGVQTLSTIPVRDEASATYNTQPTLSVSASNAGDVFTKPGPKVLTGSKAGLVTGRVSCRIGHHTSHQGCILSVANSKPHQPNHDFWSIKELCRAGQLTFRAFFPQLVSLIAAPVLRPAPALPARSACWSAGATCSARRCSTASKAAALAQSSTARPISRLARPLRAC